MLWRGIIGTLLVTTAAQAPAAPLVVRVMDSKGHPISDAVVSFRAAGSSARPTRPGSYTISQKDTQFHPFVSVVPVGARVSFPNFDPTRHHVYSFSPVKKFELKLFAKDQSRSVTFERAGIVALGCNIHDAMTAFVFVTDNQWTAKTGANGMVRFADAPNSAGRLSVWHPYLRAKANVVERPIAASERSSSFTVALRSPPMNMGDGY